MRVRALPVLALAALAVSAVGLVIAWPAFLRSWLTAALIVGALPLGAVAVLMTHGLTGGAWGNHSQPVWLALAATLPLFALAMLPLLLGLEVLFPWTAPAARLPEVVQNKLAYLNLPLFVLRTLLYLAIWLALPWLLGAWGRRPQAVHAPGLILWALTLTFFGVDWVLSLEPAFYSDVFGLMLMTGSVASAMAAGVLAMAGQLPAAIRQDVANLWLAVLLGWVFVTFSQLIIVWSANLPHEIGWYLRRREPPWGQVVWVALLLYAIVPVAILLSSAAKRHAGWLRAAALSCLAGHVLYVHWLILPAFGERLPAQRWLGPATLLALGGGCLWVAQHRWRGLTEAKHG